MRESREPRGVKTDLADLLIKYPSWTRIESLYPRTRVDNCPACKGFCMTEDGECDFCDASGSHTYRAHWVNSSAAWLGSIGDYDYLLMYFDGHNGFMNWFSVAMYNRPWSQDPETLKSPPSIINAVTSHRYSGQSGGSAILHIPDSLEGFCYRTGSLLAGDCFIRPAVDIVNYITRTAESEEWQKLKGQKAPQ